MSEELDNDLKKRISEVFDNYEDHTADDGWMLLRDKFPAAANNRGTAWLWWASAAAVFLLFAGVGIWLTNYGPDNTAQMVVKKRVEVKQQATPGNNNIPANPETPATGSNNETTGNYAGINNPAVASKTGKSEDITSSKLLSPAITGEAFVSNTSGLTKKETELPVNDKTTPNKQLTIQPAEQYAAKAAQTPVTNQTPAQQLPASDISKPILAAAKDNKSVAQTAENSAFLSMLEKENQLAERSAKQKPAEKSKNVHFGVYAATYVNYAKGSDNKVNVGAGFSSDFRINKNLKLSTGVSIAQNSFNYTGGKLPEVASKTVAQFSAPINDNKEGFTPATVAPTLQNYNASLVGLDIPLNLKFEFNPEKNDTYISAGLSSGTFISENYSYKYSQSAPFSTTSKEVDEKINESFNNFYFAKTLNVSFGIGYPLGKRNRLIIEPFVKYPLAGLGTQQIKFGSGGINLKLNIQTRK
ncbi:MAG: hypothetical protein EOP47_15315 [Sphingobacteriaceae bacterium]|nr:MAG: hypothetical protein EOP47_15315 [Sphingobacteriaceae bacterium]